jgi:hypothetical protein
LHAQSLATAHRPYAGTNAPTPSMSCGSAVQRKLAEDVFDREGQRGYPARCTRNITYKMGVFFWFLGGVLHRGLLPGFAARGRQGGFALRCRKPVTWPGIWLRCCGWCCRKCSHRVYTKYNTCRQHQPLATGLARMSWKAAQQDPPPHCCLCRGHSHNL